jgi:hypothetical protein
MAIHWSSSDIGMSLIAVLKRCRELSESSRDPTFYPIGIREIVAILNRGIEALERGSNMNRDELRLLFAPTGALQETSIDNGWGDEYLLLSAQFDRLIGELR